MLTLVAVQLSIVIILVLTSRKRLEDALPWFVFLLVLLPGAEAKFAIPGLFDLNTVRVALLTLLALYVFRRKKVSRCRVPLLSLMAMSIAWAVFTTLFSIAVATSVKQVITQAIEYYLIYYLLLKLTSKVETVHQIAYAIVIAMGICSIFGVLEVYARWSVVSLLPPDCWLTYGFGSPLYLEEGRGLRIRSTFPHPILFGNALAMTIPLAFYLLSVWKKKGQKVVLQFCIPLMFWAVYRTSSRGPWLATALSLIVFSVLVRSKARRYVATTVLLGCIAVLSRPGVWTTVSHLYDATLDSSSSIGSSYDYRYIVADAVIDAVGTGERAIVGFGMGTFRQLGLDIHFMGRVQRWFTCDNNWALFLYETGYVGLLLTAILLFRGLTLTFRGYLQLPSPGRYLHAALAIGLGAFYLGLGGVAGYSWGQQAYIMWIFIALGISHHRLAKQELRETKQIKQDTLRDQDATEAQSIGYGAFQQQGESL